MSGLTYRALQVRIRALVDKWYPNMTTEAKRRTRWQKLNEEFGELRDAIEANDIQGIRKEIADVNIVLASLADAYWIDQEDEIERKLAILAQRDDQPERDRERGIG